MISDKEWLSEMNQLKKMLIVAMRLGICTAQQIRDVFTEKVQDRKNEKKQYPDKRDKR